MKTMYRIAFIGYTTCAMLIALGYVSRLELVNVPWLVFSAVALVLTQCLLLLATVINACGPEGRHHERS